MKRWVLIFLFGLVISGMGGAIDYFAAPRPGDPLLVIGFVLAAVGGVFAWVGIIIAWRQIPRDLPARSFNITKRILLHIKHLLTENK